MSSSADEGEIINVDAHGFRVTPRPAEPPLREIWLFGGSVAWGTGNRDTGTLAAQLQQVYAERAPELRVRVLNFGESGYVSRQSLAAFQSALACVEPAADLAVFLDGANDVFATLQARRPGCRRTRTTVDASSTPRAASPRNCAPGRCAWKASVRLVAACRRGTLRCRYHRRAGDSQQTTASCVARATVRQAQAIGAASTWRICTLWQPTAVRPQPIARGRGRNRRRIAGQTTCNCSGRRAHAVNERRLAEPALALAAVDLGGRLRRVRAPAVLRLRAPVRARPARCSRSACSN
jgi:lysophospholipase L1-like esterase